MISAPLHNVTTALGNFVLFLTTLIGKKKGLSRRALPCTTAKRMNVLPIGIRCFVSRLTASKITSLTSPFTKIGCLTFVPMALVNYVSMTLIARLSSLAHSKKKKISLNLLRRKKRRLLMKMCTTPVEVRDVIGFMARVIAHLPCATKMSFSETNQ